MPTLSSIIPPINLSSVSGTIAVSNGGTGATSLTGVVKGTGASALTAGTVSLTTEVSGTLPVANGGTGATTLTANNVLLGNGTSALQAVAPGASGNILTSNGTTWTSATPAPSGPTLTAVASGSLSNGSTVIINSDGTVSVVATSVASAPSVGTEVVFGSAATTNTDAIYDSANSRVVISYTNAGNSNYGTAVVGTVSGSTITFGTPVVYTSSQAIEARITYHTAAQKVVIAYANAGNFNYGTAIVGTVSGSTISFGTAAVFDTGDTSVGPLAITYDSSQQKVVIAYTDGNNSNYGTAIVGTVSGTTITFGTPSVFFSSTTLYIAASYNTAAQKATIFFTNWSAGTLTGIVGTVSGTSISFGSSVASGISGQPYSAVYATTSQKNVVVYASGFNCGAAVVSVSGTTPSFGTGVTVKNVGTTPARFYASYDVAADRVVVALRDATNSNYGTAFVGTISGTSISFSAGTVFNAADTSQLGITYDSTNKITVTSYRDSNTFGTAVSLSLVSTNLTSENFIGFSSAAYSNGQTAVVRVAGAVDAAQSGLTPGQAYYVQGDGTLGLSPATPSVFAGTAVATTKIIVKG